MYLVEVVGAWKSKSWSDEYLLLEHGFPYKLPNTSPCSGLSKDEYRVKGGTQVGEYTGGGGGWKNPCSSVRVSGSEASSSYA